MVGSGERKLLGRGGVGRGRGGGGGWAWQVGSGTKDLRKRLGRSNVLLLLEMKQE